MNSILKETNSIENYYFPFEGEEHLATAIMIPYREDTWRNNAFDARKEFLNVIKEISNYEPVIVIIDPRIDYKTVSMFQLNNVHILRLKYDDSWARDILPIFLKSDTEKRIVGVDFSFNAWGGEYDGLYYPYLDDDNIGKEFLLECMISRNNQKGFVLEGGSVHSNGNKTLLTTKECLLSKGRNPQFIQVEIEEKLKKTLNVNKVIFLPYGIYEDETDGHVDNVACFLDEHTILLATCKDENDPEFERSKINKEFLEEQVDAYGNKFNIIEMPLPKPMYLSKEEEMGLVKNNNAIKRLEGRRLAGSYVNFYMGNKFILLPQFNVEEDKLAIKILDDFYQGKKKIIPIVSKEILLGGGNIHCITKQIPYMDNYPLQPEDKDL